MSENNTYAQYNFLVIMTEEHKGSAKNAIRKNHDGTECNYRHENVELNILQCAHEWIIYTTGIPYNE